MVKMSCEEFIFLTRSEPENWINCCEVLMTREGDIILAVPSHQEAIIEYVSIIENTSTECVKDFLRNEYLLPTEFYAGKYKVISVWYDYMIRSEDITSSQNDSINMLKAEGLIDSNSKLVISHDFSNYLFRKSLADN